MSGKKRIFAGKKCFTYLYIYIRYGKDSRSWRVKVIKGHYHFQTPKDSGHFRSFSFSNRCIGGWILEEVNRKGWRLHSPLTERKSPRCISHQGLKSSFNFYEVQPSFGCTSFKHTVELVYLSRDQRLNLLLFWQCLALFFSSSWPVAPWCQRHIAWAMMHSYRYTLQKRRY